MRLLLYNRVQFDDPLFRGGGVTLYLRNFIQHIIKNTSIDVTFLSSGTEYDAFSRKIYWKKKHNIFEEKNVKSYEIMNSPIKAPAKDAFGDIKECLRNEKIATVFVDFINKTGPYDFVHFHNIEGLSVRCIKIIKENFDSKLIYTFHNYHLICPQIELFRYESELCHDYEEGAACLGCLKSIPNSTIKKYGQGLSSLIARIGIYEKPLGNALFKIAAVFFKSCTTIKKNAVNPTHLKSKRDNRLLSIAQTNRIENLLRKRLLYKDWRENNIETINNVIDSTIAVSNQVKERLVALGIYEEKLHVVHNGMDIFKNQGERKNLYDQKDNRRVHIAFIGYPITSKGLDFFIESLLQINNLDFIEKTKIHIVSKISDQIRRKLVRLRYKGYDLLVLEGYERDDISKILSGIDLGVVPSLWWETFNQVGYEMIMHGLPVLLSDTVGIKDFIENKKLFLFTSGDKKDFAEKVIALVQSRKKRTSFWDQPLRLPSMRDNVKCTMGVYQNTISKQF